MRQNGYDWKRAKKKKKKPTTFVVMKTGSQKSSQINA